MTKLPAILQEQADIFGTPTKERSTRFFLQREMADVAAAKTPLVKTIEQLQTEIRAKDALLATAKMELDTAWSEVQRLQKELHRIKTKKQNQFSAARRITKKEKS